MKIKVSDIHIDQQENCRESVITTYDVKELAASIKEKGLLQPILVRPKTESDRTDKPYVLVAGFRRTVAHQSLGLDEIDCVVKDMTQQEAVIANFIENLTRKDLTFMEEAEVVRRFMRMGMTRTDIVQATGKTDGWLQPRMYVTQLEPQIQNMAKSGLLSAQHIRDLYSCASTEERLMLAKEIRAKREKGYTGQIKLKKNFITKRDRSRIARHRSRSDILNLIDHFLAEELPMGLHTRALAWCAGEISDNEFAISIQEFVALGTKLRKRFKDDPEMLEALGKLGISKATFYKVPSHGFPDMSDVTEAT